MKIKLNTLKLIGIFSVVTLFSALSAVSVSAQSNLPDGSYKETCKNFRFLKQILTADCEDEKGQWVNSKINLDYCEGDIRNENGTLKCKQKPAPKPPSGSYKNSCRDVKVKGSKLSASCENKKGKWKDTSINYKKCDRDIWNDNGELSCGKKNGSKIPKGSYRNSCKDSYTEGSRLYSTCEKRNGKWKKTNINYKKCDKDISNDNGELICGKSNGGKLPPGSYKDSCKNIYVEGKVLEADCKNKNGKYKHSSIKYKNCNKGIWNDNGKLRCN